MQTLLETEHTMYLFGRGLFKEQFFVQIKKARVPTGMNSHNTKPKALSIVH